MLPPFTGLLTTVSVMHRQAALVGTGNANGVTSAVIAVNTAHRTNNLAIFTDLMSYPTSCSAGLLRVVIPLLGFRLSNADDGIILPLRKAG